MRVALAAAVALLLPAGCLSLGQLSIGGQQSVRDAEDFSELYKDFDADVQALLRGDTGGPGDPLSADALEEPGRVQQDSRPPSPMPPLPRRTASLSQQDSQPQERAAEASAEAQLAADLAQEPTGAGVGAPLAEALPWAPEADVALPLEQDAGTVALEETALPEASAEPLAGLSLGEAPPAVALEALPMVPGDPRLPAEAPPAVALEALPMVPGAPRLPAEEQRTVAPVQLYNTGLATEIIEEAPPNLDDVLARTEKIATILAQDSGKLAMELSQLKRKLKGDRASLQRTLATEATPPANADDLVQGPTPGKAGQAAGSPGEGTEKEKGGGGWLEKSTISSPILTLNHQLADYPTYMFWSGVSLLSIILCCSCCVRPLMRRRQDARDAARLL